MGNMYQYSIKESAEDVLDTVVEKSGVSFEFPIRRAVDDVKALEKLKTEIETQRDLEAAKMTNYENNNEFLSGLTNEQKHAANLWWTAFDLNKQCVDKLVEINKALEETRENVEKIKEHTGLDF